MSETCFTLFFRLLTGIECILYAICISSFFHSFMDGTQNKKRLRKNAFLIFLIYITVYLLCMFPWCYGWTHMILVTVILLSVSAFLGMERNFVFLLSALFYCIRNLSMMMMRSVDFFTSEYFLRNADTPELVFRNASFNHFLIEVGQFLLFSLLLGFAKRQLKKGGTGLHIRELCYLLLTPATAILFANILVRLLVVANDNHVFRLYEQYPALIAIVPAMAALFYAGILAAIAAYQRILALQEDRKKYFVTAHQLSAMEERIREVERFHESIRRMKHEMKNHLTNIRGLAKSSRYEDMETYIARMDDSMKVFEFSVHTGNAVTDVIINDRRKTAAALGIDFQCAFSYPGSDKYNAYDIGIILSNLLQNALEACAALPEATGYIRLSGRQKKKFFLIDVRNPFDGQIIFDKNTGLPVSTKENTGTKDPISMHGIGLSNVKREAEKYMGDVDIRTENNEFHVTVLLQEKRQFSPPSPMKQSS